MSEHVKLVIGEREIAPDEKTETLFKFEEGNLQFASDFLLWASDWAKQNGYNNAMIRNIPSGYEIYVIRK